MALCRSSRLAARASRSSGEKNPAGGEAGRFSFCAGGEGGAAEGSSAGRGVSPSAGEVSAESKLKRPNLSITDSENGYFIVVYAKFS